MCKLNLSVRTTCSFRQPRNLCTPRTDTDCIATSSFPLSRSRFSYPLLLPHILEVNTSAVHTFLSATLNCEATGTRMQQDTTIARAVSDANAVAHYLNLALVPPQNSPHRILNARSRKPLPISHPHLLPSSPLRFPRGAPVPHPAL